MNRFILIAMPVLLLLALLSGGRIASAGIPTSVSLAINGGSVGPVFVSSGSTATATIGVFGAPGRVYVVGCPGSPCSAANAYSIGSPVVTAVPAGGSTTITFTPVAAYPFYAAVLEPQAGRYYSNTIEVTSVAPNQPPTGAPDFYTVNQDTPVTVEAGDGGVLFNDTDLESDPLTALLIQTTPNGTLILEMDGGFTYTPDPGYAGPDSFTYAPEDASSTGNTTTASINVIAAPSPSPSPSPTNTAPFAAGDSYGTSFNNPLTLAAPGVLANDTDADGDALTVSTATQPSHGSLTFNPDGGFTYTPSLNYVGPDLFTYVISDGITTSNTATATIEVGPPENSAPIAVGESYVTSLNTPIVVAPPGVLGNDTDADTDPLTAVLVAGTANGILALNTDGSFTYTPGLNYSGADAFTYRASDGTATSGVATVTIDVTAAPSPSPSSSPSETASPSTSPSGSASASASASASPSASVSVSASASASESASASGSVSASASASAFPSPAAGSPAPDAVVLEAFIEQDDSLAGGTVYLDEETVETTATGDRRPATEGELTFVVVDSVTNTILDEDSTDADGIVVLDAETGALFFIYEVGEPDESVYGSPDYLLIGDETLNVEVTRYVAVQPASASPMTSASPAASASAVASATASAVASAAPSTTPPPSAGVSDDGTTMPSVAPAASTGIGAGTTTSTLPNTGIGTGPSRTRTETLLWLALLGTAVALVAAAGLRVRRR